VRWRLELALVGLLAACSATSHDRSTTIETAVQRLAAYEGPGLEDDVAGLRASDGLRLQEAVLLYGGDAGYLFVCHLFWTVAVCLMDGELNLLDVQSFSGKCGFGIDTSTFSSGLTITFHEHPGTDMFYDTCRSVTVHGGRMVIGDPQ
jgi:hypothetical protein